MVLIFVLKDCFANFRIEKIIEDLEQLKEQMSYGDAGGTESTPASTP